MERKPCPPSCVDCAVAACRRNQEDRYPEFCLTKNMDPEILAEVQALYQEPENNRITRMSAKVEAEHYCQMTRVEEIAQFAKEMGYEKLGIATCVGLLSEARIAAKVFRAKGLQVYGVACKCGAQRKSSVGIDSKCEAIGPNMGNPILQARLLAEAGTELNVVVGLCVGHDSLFYKYSQAPVTTLITKDRVTGHNPAAALYLSGGYYSRLLKEEE